MHSNLKPFGHKRKGDSLTTGTAHKKNKTNDHLRASSFSSSTTCTWLSLSSSDVKEEKKANETLQEMLGLNASEQDPTIIKHAYRVTALTLHPDKNPQNAEQFKRLIALYEAFSKEQKGKNKVVSAPPLPNRILGFGDPRAITRRNLEQAYVAKKAEYKPLLDRGDTEEYDEKMGLLEKAYKWYNNRFDKEEAKQRQEEAAKIKYHIDWYSPLGGKLKTALAPTDEKISKKMDEFHEALKLFATQAKIDTTGEIGLCLDSFTFSAPKWEVSHIHHFMNILQERHITILKMTLCFQRCEWTENETMAFVDGLKKTAITHLDLTQNDLLLWSWFSNNNHVSRTNALDILMDGLLNSHVNRLTLTNCRTSIFLEGGLDCRDPNHPNHYRYQNVERFIKGILAIERARPDFKLELSTHENEIYDKIYQEIKREQEMQNEVGQTLQFRA
jgi:hypothetical protein